MISRHELIILFRALIRYSLFTEAEQTTLDNYFELKDNSNEFEEETQSTAEETAAEDRQHSSDTQRSSRQATSPNTEERRQLYRRQFSYLSDSDGEEAQHLPKKLRDGKRYLFPLDSDNED